MKPNALSRLSMAELVSRTTEGMLRTRVLSRLAYAETWWFAREADWIGPFPSPQIPAREYVKHVWPAKLLVIKGFGPRCLHAVENALAAANL